MRNKMEYLSIAFSLAAVLVAGWYFVNQTMPRAEAQTIAMNSTDTITVQQKYSTTVTPDKATISFSVDSYAKTAENAQEKNTKTIDAVVKALKDYGLSDKSIETEWYNISPDYVYRLDSTSSTDSEIKGYMASSTLTVKDINADEVGKAISLTVKAGATRVSGVNFFSSKYDDIYNKALAQAVKDSKAKAESIAAAADRKLGSVMTVTEGYQNDYGKYVTASTNDLKAVQEDASADATIMPGDLTIDAEVTVVYRMR